MNRELPVTVLMSTHNDERYIEEAIVSILRQTLKNFEFLIIDDASTDGTPDILDNYRREDSRISLVRNESNLGLTKSLNVGLKLAKGKYIARMDGDDISQTERLEHQYAYMSSNSNCTFLATEGVLIGESGKRLKNIRIDFKGLSQKDYILNYGSPFIHSSMMFSKQKILEMGGYDESYKARQDLELWLRIIYSSIEISVLKKPLIKLRYHSMSLSHESIENLYLNVMIRVLYRAKYLGIVNVSKEEIESMVKLEPAINNYVLHVLARRKLKTMISSFISGDLTRGAALFFKLIPSLHLALSRPVQLMPVIDGLLKNIQALNNDGRYDDATT